MKKSKSFVRKTDGQEFVQETTVVEWYDNKIGTRFGRFLNTDGKVAVVLAGDKKTKVPLQDLQIYKK